MTDTVFIVDSDANVAEHLKGGFTDAGFVSVHIRDGKQALNAIKTNLPSVIILERSLPILDGFTLCREVRKFSDVPILFLSSSSGEIDRLLGLEYGADDYICKPYSPREVVSRVKAVLRRTRSPKKGKDSIVLNSARLQISYFNKKVDLTKVEFQMMQLLISEPGDIFSRKQLIDTMYSDNRIISKRTIDSHIKKLRLKMNEVFPGSEVIHSVYGTGYKFEFQ